MKPRLSPGVSCVVAGFVFTEMWCQACTKPLLSCLPAAENPWWRRREDFGSRRVELLAAAPRVGRSFPREMLKSRGRLLVLAN